MAKKKLDVVGIACATIALLGIVFAVIGVFAALVTAGKQSISLSDEFWDTLGKAQNLFGKVDVDIDAPSRAFTIVAYIITFIGAVAVMADIVIRLVRGKSIKYVGLIAGAITIIGGALILISGIVLQNRFNEYIPGDNFKIDLGIYMGFIGGLIAGAAGLVSSFLPKKK